jgi:hypothetical protein
MEARPLHWDYWRQINSDVQLDITSRPRMETKALKAHMAKSKVKEEVGMVKTNKKAVVLRYTTVS